MTGKPHIYVLPTELWSYVLANRKLIQENTVVIADDGNGTEIVTGINEDGWHTIEVYRFGHKIREEQIVSKGDALLGCTVIYGNYLLCPAENDDSTNVSVPAKTVLEFVDDEEGSDEQDDEQDDEESDDHDDAPDEDAIIEDAIKEREASLYDALNDFLAVALEEQDDLVGDDEFFEILDEFLIKLADRGYDIYRPTMTDGDLVEYPYAEL